MQVGAGAAAAAAAPGNLRLAVGLGLLLALTLVTLLAYGVRRLQAVVTASARAAVQLAVVALAIRGVLSRPYGSALVLSVMLATAAVTAARRLRELPGTARGTVLSMLAGAAPTLAVAFAVPLLPRSGRYVVALGGITLGGTMTAVTLAGRQLLTGLRTRRDEVEAWLSLGATPRQATEDVARRAVAEALLPALDQTRTVGLVTLPGAFIGALLGGAGVTSAARFQLVVLVALLCAETLAATVLMLLLGAPKELPEPDLTVQGRRGRRT